MRKEFVANVSHELKTPITTIKSYAETLMLDDIGLDTQKMFLSVIDKECDRMGRLVRDLLQLSNIDYKKTKWLRSSVSLKDIIEDSINKLHILAYEKHQKIEYEIEENLPDINVDKDGIEQVLLNLISNAIKYTEEKGTIKVSAKKILNNVVLRIEDNGIGIPEEDMSRLFERFYRVEKGRSRDMGGTGLGLSIAKEILEAHGAKIKLTSEFDKGTTVSIIFQDV